MADLIVERPMSHNKRRCARIQHEVHVTIIRGRSISTGVTLDIGHHGMFVCTPDPPPLRELLRVRVEIEDGAIEIMAMAVQHRQVRGQTGVGLQFYGNAGDAQRDWDSYVRRVAGGQVRFDAAAEREFKRRRHRPVLHIDVPTVEDLAKIVNRDVRRQRTYVQAQVDIPTGTEVRIELKHPTTNCLHTLTGRVTHQLVKNEKRVLAIALVDFKDSVFSSIDAFVRGDIDVKISDDIEIVCEEELPNEAAA